MLLNGKPEMSVSLQTEEIDQILSLPPHSKRGEWTWELVTTFPLQGQWTEVEYLRQEFDRLVEFADGVLEFLPVPTFSHQDLVAYFYDKLNSFIGIRNPREVYFAPSWVRMAEGNIREPDVVYVRASRIKDRQRPADGADLVMEVVSPDKPAPERDYVTKRQEYAATAIPEYWIIDPQTRVMTILVLAEGEYRVHGEFQPGDIATSVLLPGFSINVAEAFALAEAT